MKSIDKETRIAIAQAVKQTVEEIMSAYTEVWLSEEELLKQFQMLNKDWMKKYGCTLPRTQFEVTVFTKDKDGKILKEERATHWAYARNKIQEMIQQGTHQTLTLYKYGKQANH